MYRQFSGTCHPTFSSVNILQNQSTFLIILFILEGLCLLTVYKIITNSQEWPTYKVFTVSQKPFQVFKSTILLVCTKSLWVWGRSYCYYPHFTDEDSEGWRGEQTGPVSYNQEGMRLIFRLTLSSSSTWTLEETWARLEAGAQVRKVLQRSGERWWCLGRWKLG